MTTLIFRFDGDGHRPRVSPEADLVAWGDTRLQVVSLVNTDARWFAGQGRAIRFLNNQFVTWVKPLSDLTAERYQDDLTAFRGGIPQNDPVELVGGNDFEASNGHWASVLEKTRRLTLDGKEIKRGVRAVRMCGNFMLTVEQLDFTEAFRVYSLDSGMSRTYGLPPTANEFAVSEKGWITFGYYGPSGVITPDGSIHYINVVPQESLARIVHLPNGQVWAWTSTVVGEKPLVLGRPLIFKDGKWVSDENCVQLPFPAERVDAGWWVERQSFTVAGAANLGHTTPLEVHVVPVNYPRSKVVISEPPPVELPPEEDLLNKPGITIGPSDYAKTIQNGVDTQIVYWKDRNNPGHEFRVRITNGSLKVEMTYDGWKTLSDYTGSSRPVTVKG